MNSRPVLPTIRDVPPSPLSRIADAILNLLFPETCLVCAAPIASRQDCGVCRPCWEKVVGLRFSPPWCACCGLPLHGPGYESGQLCGGCTLEPPPFSSARSFGYYTTELSHIVQALKFQGRRNIADLLGPLMASVFLESWNRDQIDMLVPIPLHPRRRRERGFNQSALLARSIARWIAIPVCDGVLTRVRHTAPQVGLTDVERTRNLKDAFRCSGPAKVRGKRILLIDDVMTTGATAASAASVLSQAGAQRVSVLTAARAVPGME